MPDYSLASIFAFMKITCWPFHLRFRHPFTISRGTKTHQPTLIVEMEHLGITGYGEAPAINYYNITVENMMADLEEKKSLIEKFSFTEPDRYWHFLHHVFPQNSFLVCALDMAAWDWFGKIHQQPLYKLWNGDPARNPITDYTIGIDTMEKMVAKMKEKPWPIYKIKVGTPDDIAIVKALREHTDSVFRVDANAAWDVDTALNLMPRLKDLGVELVEQPLAQHDWSGMKILYEKSVLPLFADESCAGEEDVDKCKNHFHGINIKLTKCSGITPALRMIKRARELDLKIMIGCMNETTVGTAAIAHLLPFIDYVDMDGPLLLAEDVATGLGYDYGKIILNDAPGLGIEFKRHVI